MQSLNGNFSKVLLHAKVDQLIILDDSIVIHIIPEHVFDEVVDLCFHLVEDADEELSDLGLLELHVAIGIELDDLLVEDLSHSEGQLVGLELELLGLECLALYLDVSPLLVLDLLRLHAILQVILK